MTNGEIEENAAPGERVEVSFRQEWIDVPPPPAPAAVIELDGGVHVHENYTQSPTVHGVFTVLASKVVTRASDVKAIHDELLAVMEDLRLVWYFSGGYWIRTPACGNCESVHARLFEAEHGYPPYTGSILESSNVIGPYRQMPLRDAIDLLRGLGRVKPNSPDEHKSALWTCLEAFQAATVAAGPAEKFMRAFPALDLLASTHYGEPALNPGAKSILRQIRVLLRKGQTLLGERAVQALSGGLRVAALRDKFEAFVKDRVPQEARALTESFRRFNRLRNDVFHRARFGAIDREAAEDTRKLLERCLQVELNLIIEEVGRDPRRLIGSNS